LRELVEAEVEGEAGKVLTKVKNPMTLRSMVMRCIVAVWVWVWENWMKAD
jgi:hypothetical protein